ncbi:MAG TPA: methyltransferase domain-containing protein [Solirubrobacterales bacterium]|nr:methyltransferase domain-containing protein [Solirubrobacterales bacterium]
MAEEQVDLEAMKQGQQAMWSTGDFSMVATAMVIVGEDLCEAVDVLPGERVLDVACGSGNATLAAARRAWSGTVGVDYVPELLEHGRRRAEVERLEVDWVEGDAENLPFEDGSFDVVLSTFGAMFAPDQKRAADELLRVCRSGGRIGMANWSPDGFVGRMFKVTGRGAAPPPGVQPPSAWGTEQRLQELFGDEITDLKVNRREYRIRFHGADHMIEYFRTYFGPVKTVWDNLDEVGREEFTAEARALMDEFNVAGDAALVAPAEYLEIVATRA